MSDIGIDTIVAPASAAGSGARALVRLSGPAAHELVAQLLEVTEAPRPGRVGAAVWHIEPGLRLPVMLLGFRAPRSYTGDDLVEMHLLGWPPLVAELVRRAVGLGARPAARGEFTRRAYSAGRLSLTQAEAVGRLALAADTETAQAAAAVLTGSLDQRQTALREALLDALALIEAHIDFEDDDTEAVGEVSLRVALTRAEQACEAALQHGAAQPSLDGETDVVLLGPPNAGKSSLLLALCPGATTSVSPRAGTTRDMLEARVEHTGRRYRLLDGPGVTAETLGSFGPQATSDEASDADVPTEDDLDRHAMQLFLEVLPRAAVVLLVEDVSAPSSPAARAAQCRAVPERALVQVWNKCDLLAPSASPPQAQPQIPAVRVSALERAGLDDLWAAVARAAPAPRAPDLAGALQGAAVEQAREHLQQALCVDLEGALPLAAFSLRDALLALDGPDPAAADITEEVLDRVFAAFCLGK